MIVEVILLVVTAILGDAIQDDTQALRNTIASLCALNSVGSLASCCASYDNGASVTLEKSDARECLIYSLRSEIGPDVGSVLTGLFVSCFF